MTKKIFTIVSLSALCLSKAFAINHTAYVEMNDTNPYNMTCYVDNDNKPFFNSIVLFAANISGTDANKPQITLNKENQELFDSNTISGIKAKGIKVIASILGNHGSAGWSTIDNDSDAKIFAQKISDFVKQYNLDGIAIDDEYSPKTNSDAIIKIITELKSLPDFKGKTVQIALVDDKNAFDAVYKGNKLADLLDSVTPGFYSQDGNISYLTNTSYLESMPKYKLIPSFTANPYIQRYSSAESTVKNAINIGMDNIMIFSTDLKDNTLNLLNQINKAASNSDIHIESNCVFE
jgi:hypothetical protein